MLSGIDLAFVRVELEELINARIKKIYQVGKKFFIKFYSNKIGKRLIKIVPGEYICFTNQEYEKTIQPSSFCMLLRKNLENLILDKIEQEDFERILIFNFKGRELIKLIVEFFSHGNLIICDKENKIIAALIPKKYKDRSIIKGEIYKYPPKKEFSFESKKEIVKELANYFGSKYAEEICVLSKIDKNKRAIDLSDAEKQRIKEKISEIETKISKEKAPQVIIENGNPIELLPFDFMLFKYKDKTKFNTFSEAIDYFYSKKEAQTEMQLLAKESERMKQLIEKQNEKLESMFKKYNELKEKANLIIKNIDTITFLLEEIKKLKEQGIPFDEIEKKISSKIFKGILEKQKEAVFEINNVEISIKINEKPSKIANQLFEKAKKLKGKIDRAKQIIEERKRKLYSEEKKEVVKEKRYWYEKFNWFFTSNNLLVIAGMNAVQNEILIKKYMKKNDLVFHADIYGSPFALLRDGAEKAKEEDKIETAKFVACFSRAWKNALPAIDVYYVYPMQLTKQTEAGEFLRKGSFVILGKKNYIKDVELKIALCFDESNNKVFCAPIESAIKHGWKFVVLKPGRETKEEISKKIREKLIKTTGNEGLKNLVLDRIINTLPEGGFQIEDIPT
ncbi:MAG: ribosome rescue protein RqcH [Candidatus Parvarchaeota archaeon]|nr:ribosome rescue protein RqcH [Candidatus Jingweiarchaeum tengchongense]MCW1298364.1 ribosome rescue protein RqcH [Candidatus Jingweiarchaeum tengchongense]MCW1300334.1 ribosome rescue protein RqcH [Candidatus Jingweiarchaeum tengchongense]MCW1304869.1 ribosome rescue protein RqcH [Candidatus Jingweiarchaeum tengchongense]MCW1305830.1 ribosome rescue protein RqcH [Candidatus Jingweiarchaeum tengchongense]